MREDAWRDQFLLAVIAVRSSNGLVVVVVVDVDDVDVDVPREMYFLSTQMTS